MQVVLDTSVLLDVFERKLDVFSECERALGEPCKFFATKSSMVELSSMAARGNAKGRAAKACITLAGKKFLVLESTGKADDALLALDEKQFAVATNDKKLAVKLRRAGIRVLAEFKNGMRRA